MFTQSAPSHPKWHHQQHIDKATCFGGNHIKKNNLESVFVITCYYYKPFFRYSVDLILNVAHFVVECIRHVFCEVSLYTQPHFLCGSAKNQYSRNNWIRFNLPFQAINTFKDWPVFLFIYTQQFAVGEAIKVAQLPQLQYVGEKLSIRYWLKWSAGITPQLFPQGLNKVTNPREISSVMCYLLINTSS